MIDAKLSHRITTMKLLCAVLVVFTHCQFVGNGAVHHWLREFVMYGICRIAVPFFFTVSGYFLAAHIGEPKWWRSAIQKRFWSLIVPYVVWCGLFIVVSYMILSAQGRLVLSPVAILKDIGFDLRCPPLLVPLWYVRALLILILLSPLLGKLIMKSKVIALFYLLSLGWVCFIYRPYSDCGHSSWYCLFNYGISLEGLLYFSIGVYLNKYPIGEPARMTALLSLISGVLLFVTRAWLLIHTEYQWLACQIGFFAIPFLLFGVFSLLPSFQTTRFIEKASFPVYVSHLFFLAALGGRLSRGGAWRHFPPPHINQWVFRGIFTILMSITMFWVLNRYCPNLSSIVFGERSSYRRKRV